MGIIPTWWRRSNRDAELDEEFATHLSLEAERQIGNGLSPQEAEDAARRSFGNRLKYREEVRELGGMMWFERLGLDLRYAARALVRRPLATAAAIVALAFGMGGPVAILAMLANVANAVFPQVVDPERLVTIWETPPNQPGRRQPVADATWHVWQQHADFFAAISACQPPLPISLTLGEIPENVSVQPMAATLLPMLGVTPLEGRGFVASDEDSGAPPVVLIAYRFWQTRLGAAADAVGRTLHLDGRAHTIVGIMPRGFWISTSADVDLFVPLPARQPPDARYIAIARLHRGDHRDALASRLAGLQAQVAAAIPQRDAGWGVAVGGMRPRTIFDDALQQPGIVMLLVAAVLALLVACTNVAMLMVARGAARQKETAVRAALGAARWRLVRQFVAESTIVAVAGGALALFVVYAAMRLIIANASLDDLAAMNAGMDWRVVAGVLTISMTVGVAAGLAPAFADSRVNLVAALKETGFFSAGPRSARIRRSLVVIEVAMTVMLLASVSMLIRGAMNLENANPGFDTSNLFILRINSVQHIGREASREPDFRRTLDRIRQVTGVEHAAAAASAVWSAQSRRVTLNRGGADTTGVALANVNAVEADYFTTLGLRVIEGQTFGPDAGEGMAVVSQAFARQHWPGDSALGRALHIDQETQPRQIVAVVSDQFFDHGRRAPSAIVFVPYAEQTRETFALRTLTLVVRTVPGGDVIPSLRRAIADMDPLQPVNVTAVQTILEIGAQEVRLGAMIATPLMLLALLLTVSGIYGLLAQSVSQRTHELAVRVTLGAGRVDLLRLVAREGLLLAGIGAAAGIAAAWMVDQSLSAFLFGVPGEEPLALAAAAAAMMLITLLASMAPYRRALRIDPGRTLRYE